uniref:CHD C-terminal 2 domain-containing protein n=1 Tax=Panagrolaimus sp. ES5 TaxID=591445 RepID=A0AC34F3C5_9BILA
MNDARFAVINEPFKSQQGKRNFLDFKIEFLQRRFKLLEQALIIEEELKKAEKLNISSAEPPRPSQKENFEDTVAVGENLQSLVTEAANDTRSDNVALHKVLTQLEELLNEMKGDISRLPATLTHFPVVSKKLQMTERQILNRLTTEDSGATAGLSSLPPPGPFVTPAMNQKFNGIQPKFAALHDEGFINIEEKNAAATTLTNNKEEEEKKDVTIAAAASSTEVEKVEEKYDIKKEEEKETTTNGTFETKDDDTTEKEEEIKQENGNDDVEMQESYINGNDQPSKLEANGMHISAAASHQETSVEVEEEVEKMDTSEDVEQQLPSTKESSSATEEEKVPESTA